MNMYNGPLEEPAGEWFVNRKEELELFWEWGAGIPHLWRNSWALLGLRRTGKTAILHKTFNRLYNEQRKVVPIYISFVQYLNRHEPIDSYEFAEEYFGGYIRSYLAFKYEQPHFHSEKLELADLRDFAAEKEDKLALRAFRSYDNILSREHVRAHNIMQWVINIPKGYAWTEEMPTAMFVDEFQVLTKVYNPDSDTMRDLTDSFQHACETRHAPMLVSGSSVSMMAGDALSGLLSGRFNYHFLKPLLENHAVKMIFRLAQIKGIHVTEELAAALWKLTEGYPYSIECILNSRASAAAQLPNTEKLDEIVFYELTNPTSPLWQHYEAEYGKYVRVLNGSGITRKILYWIVLNPDAEIYPRRIAKLFDLDVMVVREALEKLYKIDIIDRTSSTTFKGPTDPLMMDFLKRQHYMDVEDLTEPDANLRLRQELNRKQGEMNRQAGHFTEIIVGGLMRCYDDQELDGETYFNTPGQVILNRLYKIERRAGVIKDGIPHEIDIVGQYMLLNDQLGNPGWGVWMVSVRYQKKAMGESEVEAFIRDVAALQEERQYGKVIRWYFSRSGFTKAAKARLRKEGIYFSDLKQFNLLCELFDLMPLAM